MNSPFVPAMPLPLTGGMTAWVSPEDFRRAIKVKWCPNKREGRTTYAQANVKVGGRWRRVLLHRYLLAPPAGVVVDHENGDGLDCTRGNMRLATRGQNQHNSGPRKWRFKGVSWHKKAGKWRAQIMADRKYRYLGLHATAEDAARAYDAAAKKLHGGFAWLNFPTDDTPRGEMRRELLAEVELAVAARAADAVAVG